MTSLSWIRASLVVVFGLALSLWYRELSRPALTIVGNVTIDVVNGKKAVGGAVSYAAAVAEAWGVRACIVTTAGADADLSPLAGHDVVLVPTDKTLTFEHSYTFWGNKRKLRVTAQPNVTLTAAHVPRRCRRARVLLLCPLMPEDMDVPSFLPLASRVLHAADEDGVAGALAELAESGVGSLEGAAGGDVSGRALARPPRSATVLIGASAEEARGREPDRTAAEQAASERDVFGRPAWQAPRSTASGSVASARPATSSSPLAKALAWLVSQLEPPTPAIGLMSQGLQRSLDSSKRVAFSNVPSSELERSLSPTTTIFMSDVETDVWPRGEVDRLASLAARFVVTRGEEGADEHRGRGAGAVRHPPARLATAVVDTNGAGDSFATAWMLAAAEGHPDPSAVANWAGAAAVSKPQACKPACVADALVDAWPERPEGRLGSFGIDGEGHRLPPSPSPATSSPLAAASATIAARAQAAAQAAGRAAGQLLGAASQRR